MGRRRAKNEVAETSDQNTGSSLYSRIGTTHMATRYWRISRGSTESSRYRNHSCWTAACSRSVPSGRVGDDVRRGGPPDGGPCTKRVESTKAANVMSVEIPEEVGVARRDGRPGRSAG